MKITILIPALNEEESLPFVINRIPKYLVNEVLVIDGNSTDKTVEVAESLGCRVLRQPGKGLGAGMRFGFSQAIGDLIVCVDADGSQQPEDIVKLIAKYKEGGYDLVLGSRYLSENRGNGMGSADDTLVRYLGNKLITGFTNIIHGIRLSDAMFMFNAMSKDMLMKLDLKSDDFSICVEIPVKAHRGKYNICEIALPEPKRIAGYSKVSAFSDGLKIFKAILSWR